MNKLEAILATLEYSLSTKRKRHIAGGILLSVAVLFGGLAFTVITLKTEDVEEENLYE